MRKNALAMSVAALVGGLGFVGAASADVIVGTGGATPTATTLGLTNATQLQVNVNGIGHSLITPYFNTQNGNATLITLTNTDTVNGKAVKVRFRGASNSDDIFDFTVLMSPGDVWNATVTSPSATTPTQIVTNDRSCTVPQFTAGKAESFITVRLTNKNGTDVANNTREGYVEIFNMADIPPNTGAGGGNSALYNTIKHTSAGVPKCDALGVIEPAIVQDASRNVINHTVEATAAGAGLATPTTGLYGSWVILNVPQTTTYTGDMPAIRALDINGNDARGNFVLFAQSQAAYTAPAGKSIDFVTADPLLRTIAFAGKSADALTLTGATATPAIPALNFDLPDMSTPYVTPAASATAPLDQANVLTSALAVKSFANDYATDTTLSFKTDWVVSMPTRRYSVAMNYAPSVSIPLFSLVPSAGNQFFHNGNIVPNGQQICVNATTQTFYDREEQTAAAGSGAVFSPGVGVNNTAQFCGEVSVLSFADSGVSALGGSVARQDTTAAFSNGWGLVNVTFPGTGLGLPILGNSYIKGTNPAVAAGQSGTYGFAIPHRAVR